MKILKLNFGKDLINYMKFEQARSYVHKLKINSTTEWRKYYRSGKLPPDIPLKPRNVYKNKGWISMGDWLGTGNCSTSNSKFIIQVF